MRSITSARGLLSRLRGVPDPPALRASARIFVVILVLFTLTRAVLTFRLETTGWSADPGGILVALVAGVGNDLGTALSMSALGYLLITLCGRRGLRSVAHLLLGLGLVVVVFGAVAEVFFWDEFASRLNGIAVFYLIFPREVIGNLNESFDLGLLLPPIVVAGGLLWWWSHRSIQAGLAGPSRRGRVLRGGACAALGLAVGVLLALVQPTRVLDNRELAELALNGPANMVRAALTNDSAYDGVYPGIEESRALPLLRWIVAQENTRFLDDGRSRSVRRYVDNGSSPRRLNIVLVIEESFGSIYVDGLDSTLPKPVTPALTELARDGLFFTNVYASGQRSVRGLEALLTSFTPIPGIAVVRRPGSKGMYSLPYVLKQFGYQSAMLYGGRAAFDNMGPFWWGIGFDHVWDQNDIRHQSFTTAWGVSDEDLFAEALDRMDERTSGGRPFLLTLFTVSNHRPYKFPQTHIGWDPELGNRGNSARYADWAFGDFIQKARSRAWFDDTVFVFVADHGHKVNGAAQVPLHRYRIPLLVYSPKNVPARAVPTLAAQIDLIPTLLGLLGMSYESPFFGIDLLRVPADGGRIVVAHNFSVAFARPGHAVVLNPDGTEKGYRFIPGREVLEAEPVDDAIGVQARALTQTAHRMFYNREYHVTQDELARWARHGGSWDKQLERERSYAGPSRSPAGADASGDASSAGS